ncbi:MAG: carbohydrate ABC transporter permease [Chloroflexi bacterium]|nr:carbohydrate ABC transporter permease [Chloroflexota bacterium]
MTLQSSRMSPRKLIGNIFLYGLLSLVALALGTPVLWFLVSSVKTESEYIAYPIKFLPKVVIWQNYVDAVTLVPFWKYAGHSAFLATVFAILTVITSSMAGYAFARVRAPGRDALFTVVLALLIVPGIVTTIPQFIVFSRLRLTNTYWPWVLWGLSASPFHIFLFRQFFSTIPKQLEDAAEVDGCSQFRIYAQIFLPNSKPVLATSFIFNFSWTWSDWFAPLIYLDDQKTTLAVKLTRGYQNPQGFTMRMPSLAAAVIYTVPLIVLFFIGQRYIIQGVVTSGLKG